MWLFRFIFGDCLPLSLALHHLLTTILPLPLHARVGHPRPFFFFRHSAGGTKKRDWIPLPPDHPIGHISGRGWSWRTIERSIPSHFASRFQRLFDIGAATRARGARSVNKGQIWGEFEANFWATPALGGIPRPHRPPVHRSRRLTVWYHGERWGRAGPALIRSVEWCIRERRGGILLPTVTVGSAAVSSAARGRLRQRSDGVGGGGGGEQRGGGSGGGRGVAAAATR